MLLFLYYPKQQQDSKNMSASTNQTDKQAKRKACLENVKIAYKK